MVAWLRADAPLHRATTTHEYFALAAENVNDDVQNEAVKELLRLGAWPITQEVLDPCRLVLVVPAIFVERIMTDRALNRVAHVTDDMTVPVSSMDAGGMNHDVREALSSLYTTLTISSRNGTSRIIGVTLRVMWQARQGVSQHGTKDVAEAEAEDVSGGVAGSFANPMNVKAFKETEFRGIPDDIHRATFLFSKTFSNFCTPFPCVAKRHTMWYDHTLHTLPNLTARIKNRCSHKRFVGWVVTFRSFDVHGNAMLYDRVRGEIARYEPRGFAQHQNYDVAGFDTVLRAWSERELGARYVSPQDYQHAIGPQSREVIQAGNNMNRLPSKGPCAIWSLMFMYTAGLQPDWSWAQRANFLHDHPVAATPLIQAFGHYLNKNHDESLPACERY